MDKVFIRMLESFAIFVNEQQVEESIGKSRKGLSLVQYLVLANGAPVPTALLLSDLWSDDKVTNPENALKTLVSRIRAQMNQIHPELGSCIVADRGAYHWECVPGVTVDVLEIEDLLTGLGNNRKDEAASKPLIDRLMGLYAAGFSQNDGIALSDWAQSRATSLHNRFLQAVYSYVDLLKEHEAYEDICVVCRQALDADRFDDRLHIELISALIKSNHNYEAMNQYKTAEEMKFRYLGVGPSAEFQMLYKQIITSGKSLDFSIESITQDLQDNTNVNTAYVCEYMVFRDIYNLQVRNIERYGAKMVLALIMVSPLDGKPLDPLEQDNLIQGLMTTLKHGLRKGDLITRYSPTIVALLMQMEDPTMGPVVLERIKRTFYQRLINSNVSFKYRLTIPSLTK